MNSISTMLTFHEEMIFIEKGRNIDIEQIKYHPNTNIRTWNEYI